MDQILGRAARFEELAAEVEERAMRVLCHAEQARAEAERAAVKNNGIRELRAREAEVHERSAAQLKQTAGLYRKRARELRGKTSPDSSDGTEAGGIEAPGRAPAERPSLARERDRIAAKRERLAADRESLAIDRERIHSALRWSVGERRRLATPRPPHTTTEQPTPEQAD